MKLTAVCSSSAGSTLKMEFPFDRATSQESSLLSHSHLRKSEPLQSLPKRDINEPIQNVVFVNIHISIQDVDNPRPHFPVKAYSWPFRGAAVKPRGSTLARMSFTAVSSQSSLVHLLLFPPASAYEKLARKYRVPGDNGAHSAVS